MARVLVTGGAGYIGSHMVRLLVESGHEPVVVDSLATGHADAVGNAPLVVADVGDRGKMRELFARGGFDAVLHFAGRIQVGESVTNPILYYQANVFATGVLLGEMLEAGVRRFLFSSSAAVYGQPERCPIPEEAPARPINPYGWSKWMIERVIEDASRASQLHYVALRYFNAAGAALDGTIGERHDPESHLVPLVLAAARRGETVLIHGNDYATQDGTCVRDYVHVVDLCQAHLSALERLLGGGDSGVFNLGTGVGVSVREIVEWARRVTGLDIRTRVTSRRPGDAATLVADPSRARRELGFTPLHSDPRSILESAWRWVSSRKP